MASSVTFKYRDLTETILLFEGRLHISTIKDAFTLRVAELAVCSQYTKDIAHPLVREA